jgi:large subunit ribosomal protein L13
MTKTTFATVDKSHEAMNTWHVIDASGQTLGRMATEIATILMGKHRPDYTPHILVGEGVIVTNADKIRLTGNKGNTRIYTFYTGHPGGLRKVALGEYLQRAPDEVVRLAVRRMLPKNRIARRMISRLKVYRGDAHPHVAQKPTAMKLASIATASS